VADLGALATLADGQRQVGQLADVRRLRDRNGVEWLRINSFDQFGLGLANEASTCEFERPAFFVASMACASVSHTAR
jgi:hypothetical protein